MALSAMTGAGSSPGASETAGGASVSSNRRSAAASFASDAARTACGERPDDLEAGERDERQGGEVDAVEPPRADERDADAPGP